jgi:SAM-dependent methyltransferase
VKQPGSTRTTGADRLSTLKISRNQTDYLVYKYLFRDLKYAVAKYAKGNVLDVGCGNKPYLELFDHVDSYMGCDVVQSSRNLVDVICPATDLKFESNQFDTVFCTQVLEHVDDHRKAIEEICRVLKPGGNFVFSVPFSWELHEEPYDYFRFTKYGIEFLMNKYGFEKIEIIHNGGKWAAVGQLRLSMIWSRFRNNPRRATWYKLFVKYSGLKIILNTFYSWLDKVDHDDLLTLNYVCVARKKYNP